MNAIPFEALETKVNLVLERLRVLQSEKADLQKQAEVWRERYEEAASKTEELTRECDALRHNQRDPDQEELIRSKIAALLARLEDV
ncbi:hypothetical protein KKH27_12415 [bacterium]|nr:hypothetical protein [bacterium]MBU1983788.1 hypothetical protein [bacterium]